MKAQNSSKNSMLSVIVVLTIFMILGIIIRLVIKRYRLNIPPNIFILAFSVINGVTIAKVKLLRDSWFELKMAPQHAKDAYVPILIMSNIYNIDSLLFQRYLFQSILICLSTTLVTPFLIAGFLTYILYPEWSFSHGLFLSLIILPLEPHYIVELFQGLSNFKFLATMLQTETVLAQVTANIGYQLIGSYRSGAMDKWYQFMAVIARDIIGGCIIGLLMAIILVKLLTLLSGHPHQAVATSLSMIYITYFLSSYIAYANGAMSLICLCCYLVTRKHKLSLEVDACLQIYWMAFFHLVETPMLMFAMTEVTLYAVLLFDYKTIYGAVFLYVIGSLDRLRACLMLAPLMIRLPYSVNLKCLSVIGWSGIRGTTNMYMLLSLVGRQHLTESMKSYLLGAMFYVILSNLINCTSMRVLLNMMGLLSITTVRLANLYHYMTYLREKQLYMLDILKTNRYLSNANWTSVREDSFVYEVYLQQASVYHKAMKYNEEHNFLWNERLLTCPDCHKEFRNELTSTEMEDLLKKNLLQIFKTQKMAIIKQYESGTINKNILQKLVHHLDTKIESNNRRRDATINLDKFNSNAKCYHLLIKILTAINIHQEYKPPENFCPTFRRFCYYLTLNYLYEILLILIIILNAGISLSNERYCCQSQMLWYHYGMNALFLLDLCLRLIGLGFNCLNSFKMLYRYLLSFDFCDVIFLVFAAINAYTTNEANVFDWIISYIPSYRLLSALRLITCLKILGTYSHKIAARLDHIVDSQIALRFALASAWLNSIDEILNYLPQIVSEKVALDYYTKNLKDERVRIKEELINVQKTRPWIAVTIKTKQAMRMTLFAIEMNLIGMQMAGFTDAIESNAIAKTLRKPQQFLNKMKFITPNAIRVTFQAIPWLPHDNYDVMEYIFANSEESSKDAQEIIMEVNKMAEGVYVVVTGVLLLVYQPNSKTTTDLTHQEAANGQIPIVDYLTTTDFTLAYEKVIVSGSTIGELSIITGRPCDCTIQAGSPSQGYWIPAPIIRTAMKMASHPVTGMEVQMWRHCCEGLAIATIMLAPEYKARTKEEIKNKLKSAFVPILRSYLTFVVTDLIEGVILINGTVIDEITDQVFIAPTLLPDHLGTMQLVQSFEEPKIEVHIMVVPKEEVTPLQIMQKEEEIADLISLYNSKELLLTKEQRKMTKLWH